MSEDKRKNFAELGMPLEEWQRRWFDVFSQGKRVVLAVGRRGPYWLVQPDVSGASPEQPERDCPSSQGMQPERERKAG